MADMEKVRISMWPDEVREVPVDEVPVLRAQGLLIEDGEPDGAARDTGPAKADTGPARLAAANRGGRPGAGETDGGA